jgi:hypothetical protein
METTNLNHAHSPPAHRRLFADNYPTPAHNGNKQSKSRQIRECTMRNITVAVSDDSYRQARIRAAKKDTSVSAVVQDLLLNLPGLARVARSFTAGMPTPPPV